MIKLKSYTALAIAFFAIVNPIKAQLGVGTIVGIGQSSIQGNSSLNPRLQFTLGATSNLKLTDLLGIGVDITATTKGASRKGEETAGFPQRKYTYTENYNFLDIEVPVIGRLYFGNDRLSFNLLGGIGMNFNILAASTRTYDDADRNNTDGYTAKKLSDINPTNLSYTYGLGITARAAENYYFINLRGNGGLNNLGKIEGSYCKHGGFMLTVGYLFY